MHFSERWSRCPGGNCSGGVIDINVSIEFVFKLDCCMDEEWCKMSDKFKKRHFISMKCSNK